MRRRGVRIGRVRSFGCTSFAPERTCLGGSGGDSTGGWSEETWLFAVVVGRCVSPVGRLVSGPEEVECRV